MSWDLSHSKLDEFMEKKLKEIYKEHNGKVSDKWSLYLEEWDRILSPYQNKDICLFEIGIQNGGSLEIWGKYFLKARKIIGCDIDPNCEQLRFGDPRISTIISDANSNDCEEKLYQLTTTLDVIIDDGSHKSSDIVRSFCRYFPKLNEDGLYIIEDLHSSYWENFEGGLNNPLSAISFFKRLVDIVNYEHWRNHRSRADLLAKFSKEYGIVFDDLHLVRIHSVEFINSLCVIRKMSPERNILGKRIIAGVEESVASDSKKFNGTVIQDLATSTIDDSNLDVFELITQINSQTSTIKELKNSIQSLTNQLNNDMQEIQVLNEQLIEKEQKTGELESKIQEREKLFVAYAERIARIEQSNKSLTSQLTETEQTNRRYTQEVQELAEIKSSHAWRLVKFIWKVRSSLRFH